MGKKKTLKAISPSGDVKNWKFEIERDDRSSPDMKSGKYRKMFFQVGKKLGKIIGTRYESGDRIIVSLLIVIVFVIVAGFCVWRWLIPWLNQLWDPKDNDMYLLVFSMAISLGSGFSFWVIEIIPEGISSFLERYAEDTFKRVGQDVAIFMSSWMVPYWIILPLGIYLSVWIGVVLSYVLGVIVWGFYLYGILRWILVD